MICGLSELEAAITADIGTKISWGYVNFLARGFYNLETEAGPAAFKQPVLDMQLAGDLFFGLVNALLQSDPPSFSYFKVTPQTETDERYLKIKAASDSFTAKLLAANQVLQSKEVTRFAQDLGEFFKPEDNRVKWVELAPSRCSFMNMPLDITGQVKESLNPYASVSFADALDSKLLPRFFSARLGLGDYKLVPVKEILDKRGKSAQGDLFGGLKKMFGRKVKHPMFHYLNKTADAPFLLELLAEGRALPAAILLGGPVQVREFYEQNYRSLKTWASMQVQNSSGGSNKLFRNFSINNNGLLLATDKFLLKHLTSSNPVEPVSRLRVKTLVLAHLPFEQFTHPYQEALSQKMDNAFEDYALPRALFNFHRIMKFFYSPELTDVYIVDPKLAKAYAQVFKDYHTMVPGAKLAD